MVLFYHYCQHADQLVYSVYIDATQELCEENAEIENHNHHHHNACCDHKSKEDSCCENHKSDSKTLKIKNEFNVSDRQTTPKTVSLSLLLAKSPQQVDIIHTSLTKTGLFQEIPPEIPLFLPTGRELVTSYHALKIAC